MRVTAVQQLTFCNGRPWVLRSVRRIVLHLNWTNTWKKLINRGDVFAIVVGERMERCAENVLSNFK
jgi:hypothetical protein